MTALMTTAIDWFTRVGCVHQDIFRRADGCLGLECLKCGRQTAGITVHRPSQVTAEGHARTEGRAHPLQRAA
jgi:hypothetical protein